MITLEEALGKIAAAIRPLPGETVGLSESLGRCLAVEVRSLADLPPFDNSAMDGYAVRAEDLKNPPVTLRLTGKICAGEKSTASLEPGACARVFTGAMLPQGADAVVMQEDVKELPGGIVFQEAIKPWENIRLRGEDIKANEMAAGAGQFLTPQLVALLAATGHGRVTVGKRPVVGLVATGNELSEPGQPLAPGQIYESNRAGIAALTRKAGAAPKTYPLVRDDLGLTKQALERAFQECDAVVTSGGVSVGESDYVKQAFTELGGQLDFWKVAIRPGKPFVFGRLGEKLLFGLPGNPVSAMVTFFLLVRPALLRLQGAEDLQPAVVWGKLAEPLTNRGERRLFARVIIDARGEVRLSGGQASHLVKAMSGSNGLVDVPPGAKWPAGKEVAVSRWD